MLIRTINPFAELDNLERRFWGDNAPIQVPFATDVLETKDSYVVESDLPGFRRDEIQVTVSNDILTISAAHKEQEDSNDNPSDAQPKEHDSALFTRSFDVSGFNPDTFSVTFTDGVLTVTLPKPEKKEPEVHTLTIEG